MPVNAKELHEAALAAGISRFVVGAVISSEKKEVLIVQRVATDFMGGIYELPSGKVDEGEDLEAALVREVAEETGLKVTEIIQHLGNFDYKSKSGKTTRQFNFLVKVENLDKVTLNAEEHSAYAWVDSSTLPAYSVTDSVSGILMGFWMTVAHLLK